MDKARAEKVALSGLSLAELAGGLAKNQSPLRPDVSQATLDGSDVVVVTQQDGSKLYVSNTGRPYPLHGEYKGPAAARLEFTDYGTRFRITAPANPIDIGSLLARS